MQLKFNYLIINDLLFQLISLLFWADILEVLFDQEVLMIYIPQGLVLMTNISIK